MFVRLTFCLVVCLFVADIAQPGYLKFWQPNIELSNIDVRLPNLHFNLNKSTTKISPSETSNCIPSENDLEEVLQAKFGCHDATSN